jgi:hypothetical protein
MTTKKIAGKAVETVTFILAAFSGFLKSIAPPDETKASMMVGIVSFSTLVVLLFVSAIAQGKPNAKHKRYWLAAALVLLVSFLISGFVYSGDRTRLLFLWPPDEANQQLYVGGGDGLTLKAQDAKRLHPELTPAQLVLGFGGIDRRTAVWPAEAIQHAGRRLNFDYVIMVLSLATAIFCLTEGVLQRRE